MDHVVRFGADRVVDSDHAGDLAVDRDEQGGLAQRIELAQHRLGCGIERDPGLGEQSAVADEDRVVRLAGRCIRPCTPAPGRTVTSRGSASGSDRRRASSTTTAASG